MKKNYKVKKGCVLILRTCDENLKSYNGFQWKKSGVVSAPDFMSTKECGHGLHGFLKGSGDVSLLPSSNMDIYKWLICEVKESEIIELDGKVKFPSCTVIYCGEMIEAVSILKTIYPDSPVIACTATAGRFGMATAGGHGMATAGGHGMATAG
jgi:hypothetical protein